MVEIALGGLAEQPEGRGSLFPSPKLGEGAVRRERSVGPIAKQTDLSGTPCHLP